MKRRFVPWSDALEVRVMLSTANATPVQVRPSRSVPLSTLEQRQQRIERLPFFLRSFSPGRALPAQAVEQIQQNLLLLIGQVGAAPGPGLQAVNEALRGTVSSTSVSEGQIRQLDNLFGKTLNNAGANPAIVDSLRAEMLKLAQTGVNVPNPGSVVANDYALVLQVALAVGKPLPPPGSARLTNATNTGSKNDSATSNPQPSLTGTYSPGTTIQILNQKGTGLFGSGPVEANGRYTIQINTPLKPGVYRFKLRAVGPNQIVGRPSQPQTLRILAPSSKNAGKA